MTGRVPARTDIKNSLVTDTTHSHCIKRLVSNGYTGTVASYTPEYVNINYTPIGTQLCLSRSIEKLTDIIAQDIIKWAKDFRMIAKLCE
jgi:hypothetical protein